MECRLETGGKHFFNGFHVDGGHLYEMYILAALVVVSAFYKHAANIKRLMNGTENKLSVGKSK